MKARVAPAASQVFVARTITWLRLLDPTRYYFSICSMRNNRALQLCGNVQFTVRRELQSVNVD